MIHVVGGVAIELAGELPDATQAAISGSANQSSPAIVLRLRATRVDEQLRPDGVPAHETDSWVAFVDDENVRICVKDALRTPVETARIELVRDRLIGRYAYNRPWPYVFQYPLDQLLVIHALGVAGGALMHAAAIVGRDGALLVAGPSGAGKTTMSRATAGLGAHVLSDERTIVRPDGDGWVVGGTPWPGEGGFAENRSVRLRALILLEQANEDTLLPLSPARALALLYRCHFPPVWDARAEERTLDHLEALVAAVPAYIYRNRKGPEAAERLLELVGGAA